MDFNAILTTTEYDFLRTNPRLGARIVLLGVSGSHGYGTNREGSDIDFRGVTLNLPSDLIGLTSFDQYEDPNTDTVIYSFTKLVNLLLNCNPNTIEILGLDDDQYVIKTVVGQEILDHRQLFLSKRAAASFGLSGRSFWTTVSCSFPNGQRLPSGIMRMPSFGGFRMRSRGIRSRSRPAKNIS